MTDSQFTDEDLQAYATTRAVSIAVGAALATELLSCRRDARRYAWLRSEAMWDQELDITNGSGWEIRVLGDGRNLDAAIDKAMEQP